MSELFTGYTTLGSDSTQNALVAQGLRDQHMDSLQKQKLYKEEDDIEKAMLQYLNPSQVTTTVPTGWQQNPNPAYVPPPQTPQGAQPMNIPQNLPSQQDISGLQQNVQANPGLAKLSGSDVRLQQMQAQQSQSQAQQAAALQHQQAAYADQVKQAEGKGIDIASPTMNERTYETKTQTAPINPKTYAEVMGMHKVAELKGKPLLDAMSMAFHSRNEQLKNSVADKLIATGLPSLKEIGELAKITDVGQETMEVFDMNKAGDKKRWTELTGTEPPEVGTPFQAKMAGPKGSQRPIDIKEWKVEKPGKQEAGKAPFLVTKENISKLRARVAPGSVAEEALNSLEKQLKTHKGKPLEVDVVAHQDGTIKDITLKSEPGAPTINVNAGVPAGTGSKLNDIVDRILNTGAYDASEFPKNLTRTQSAQGIISEQQVSDALYKRLKEMNMIDQFNELKRGGKVVNMPKMIEMNKRSQLALDYYDQNLVPALDAWKPDAKDTKAAKALAKSGFFHNAASQDLSDESVFNKWTGQIDSFLQKQGASPELTAFASAAFIFIREANRALGAGQTHQASLDMEHAFYDPANSRKQIKAALNQFQAGVKSARKVSDSPKGITKGMTLKKGDTYKNKKIIDIGTDNGKYFLKLEGGTVVPYTP